MREDQLHKIEMSKKVKPLLGAEEMTTVNGSIHVKS